MDPILPILEPTQTLQPILSAQDPSFFQYATSVVAANAGTPDWDSLLQMLVQQPEGQETGESSVQAGEGLDLSAFQWTAQGDVNIGQAQ